MSDFFKDFQPVNSSQWMEKITRDLKGKTIEETLHYNDSIEGVAYQAYQYSFNKPAQTPGEMPLTRGGKFNSNNWFIVNEIQLADPSAMNRKALSLLMNGADALLIDLSTMSISDCSIVIKDIQFEYIRATLICGTQDQFDWLNELLSDINTHQLTIVFQQELDKRNGIRNLLVDASAAQKVGANVIQEMAYALHIGHTMLVKAINAGFSIDDAAAKIKVNFGIGAKYYFEIAKFRAFRSLWASLISAYQPDHSCSCVPYISAETGSLNKSLLDPNTNLLRQTTEAMSAVIGGVNELLIRPYNWRSKEKQIDRSERLATNIGLILREESYLDKVIDPSGGAYALEALTEELEIKAWTLFQELESGGMDKFKNLIQLVASKRKEAIENKIDTLIGVNKYLNTENLLKERWDTPFENELGHELILERDCTIEG